MCEQNRKLWFSIIADIIGFLHSNDYNAKLCLCATFFAIGIAKPLPFSKTHYILRNLDIVSI